MLEIVGNYWKFIKNGNIEKGNTRQENVKVYVAKQNGNQMNRKSSTSLEKNMSFKTMKEPQRTCKSAKRRCGSTGCKCVCFLWDFSCI